MDTAMGLALIAGVCITAPSSAQKSDATARSAQIAELSRAGKYSEAIALAQRLLADMEKTLSSCSPRCRGIAEKSGLVLSDKGRAADALPIVEGMIGSGRAVARGASGLV
jgi:hypothetical protein